MKIEKVILIFFILSISCSQKRQLTDESIHLIQVDLSGEDKDIINLSDLTDSIRYLILDIPEKYKEGWLNMENINGNEKYIIGSIVFTSESSPSIWEYSQLIFDKENGQYLGEILKDTVQVYLKKQKENPDDIRYEWIYDSPFIFNETGENFITKSHKAGLSYGEFAVWDINTQKPINTIPVKTGGILTGNVFLENNRILQFESNLQGKGGNKISIYDEKGKLLFQNKHTRTFKAVKQAIYNLNADFFKVNDIFYYLDKNDTIAYGIDQNLNHFPGFTFYLGEKMAPYYYYYQTSPDAKGGIYSDMVSDSLSYILSVTANNNFLFIKSSKEGKNSYGIYDIKQQKTKLLKKMNSEKNYLFLNKIIHNDLDGGMPFWPDLSTEKNEFISYEDNNIGFIKKNLEHFSTEGIKDKEAHDRFIKLIKEADPSNYIITIIKTK